MLGIIIAMENEANTLLHQSTNLKQSTQYGKTVWTGEFSDTPYILIISGIGKDNASAATMLALSMGATKLLNFGIAGDRTEPPRFNQILQIKTAVEIDFDLRAINHTPLGTHNERTTPFYDLPCRKNQFQKAVIATADRFVDSDQYQKELSEVGATLCEMEGAAIAHTAWAANVPCYIFKTVSDGAGDNSSEEYATCCGMALHALALGMKDIFAEVNRG